MTESLLNQIQQTLQGVENAQRWLIGLSGGLDSCVLLSMLATLRDHGRISQDIHAIHVHHGLSGYADEWTDFCKLRCEQLNIPLQVCNVVVTNQGRGLEQAARDQRYQAFETILVEGDVLLLAHHQDDQAETLLLRLMRGAGPKGLSAMPLSRPLGQGLLFRPMLSLRREQLEDWAKTFNLNWVEDDSNQSELFDRNYLRHQVMPLLEKRWPGFSQRWQESAELCKQLSDQIESQSAEDISSVALQAERWGWSVELQALKALPQSRRDNVWRSLMSQLNLPLPEKVHLQEIDKQLMTPKEDGEPEVTWGSVSIRHYRGRLYILPEATRIGAPPTQSWDLQENLSWSTGELAVWPCTGEGLQLPFGASVKVGTRQPGDRCKPAGRHHSQTLKKLLQEYQLEPWLRDCIPVLWLNDEIVAVGDLWVCEGYQGLSNDPNSQCHKVIWQRSG